MKRRDFLNGILIGAGSGLIGGCRRSTPTATGNSFHLTNQASLNDDPRASRGGNTPSAFMVGHWLRDQRLLFENDRVEVRPSGIDSAAGRFDLTEETVSTDVL